ncbi:AP-4 complex subunit epsilon, putative [Plasmodium reichenowi]|uniref:AP-4 complex subunit epsilon, putative n=1 Tax=Plasmodium reichenowi TaxID=5854 RepID=A0A060RRW5_PLARE|nr:AP-4 complex subunit epsilon, putative [Plasmodium reichenowi]
MLGLGGSCLSKEFFDLAKSIGEARSKQEEDRIICNEIILLKSRFSDPNTSVKQIKEYLIRAIYIEMLGHDASFAHIHAVKLAHEKNILCKRTGYLSCNLFLHKDHELMLLLINTIQKDLKSDNYLEIWAALSCVCKLLNNEMIPAIFPVIQDLLNHKNELIRKKVCMLLHKMYIIEPSLIKDIDIYLKRLLCDVDPSVMGASLNLIHSIAKNDMIYSIKLVPYLVSILKQICENKLPKDYDYHRIPAPWIQIKILSIFRILGYSNKKLSEQMYEVLQKTMQRADFGINVGYAIIYECVKTIATIYPSHHLLELASLSISRFISSDNHNLKYVGVTGLALIVKINPLYATEHQLAVVDCLEDKDETLKIKTLDLLYEMTNPLNVQVIVEKLIFHMKNSVDIHFKHDLACKIIELIERYTPDDIWFLNKINTLFLSVGELLDESYSYSLIKLLKDSSICAESDSGDDEINTSKYKSASNDNINMECLNLPNKEHIKTYMKEQKEGTMEELKINIENNEKLNQGHINNQKNYEMNNNDNNNNNDNDNDNDNDDDVNISNDNNGDVNISSDNNNNNNNNINHSNNNNMSSNKTSNDDIRHEQKKNKKDDVNNSDMEIDLQKKTKNKMNDDIYNLRKYAVNTYIRLLESNENIPFILMQIICWVLGEYSHLCDIENYTTEDIIDLLCECLEKNFSNPDRVKSCLITAIFKLCSRNNIRDHVVAKKIIDKYKNSKITDLQQRCYEYDLILNNPILMNNVFSLRNTKKKIVIDETLSFLNPYIEEHLRSGGKSYISKDLRKNEQHDESIKSANPVLNFTPYELPLNNKLSSDNYNISSNNIPIYGKNYNYQEDAVVPMSATDEQASIMKDKGKIYKLNVMGPKKWKKEIYNIDQGQNDDTDAIEKRDLEKKKKKKKSGRKNNKNKKNKKNEKNKNNNSNNNNNNNHIDGNQNNSEVINKDKVKKKKKKKSVQREEDADFNKVIKNDINQTEEDIKLDNIVNTQKDRDMNSFCSNYYDEEDDEDEYDDDDEEDEDEYDDDYEDYEEYEDDEEENEEYVDESDDDDEDENDDDDDYHEEEQYNRDNVFINEENENEKRTDNVNVDDYNEQNYERFDNNKDIHYSKEFNRFPSDNYHNKVNNKTNVYNWKIKGNINTVANNKKELTEKEKMAAALFNGLISNNSQLKDPIKSSYVSTISLKKNMSILSNKNYFTSKKYDNNNDMGGIRKKSLHNEQVENRDVTKMKINEKGNNNNNNEGGTNKLVDINVDNSDHLKEIKKNKKNKGDQFDMIDLNELPKKIDPTKSSDINIEEEKKLWDKITTKKKAVFINSTNLNILQTLKKIENNINTNVIEVSKMDSLISCFYNNTKVLIKIKIEDNKLVFLVKSNENSIIDNVFDVLKNLFHI